uniref:Dna repair metallo-beta-lactamase domain-containing protein n=1 Tax=Tetraselmis sp. GSL018 TaxID=582737 RepID=A0A061RID5_9CHLO
MLSSAKSSQRIPVQTEQKPSEAGSLAKGRPPPWKQVPGTDFVVDGFNHCGGWSKHYFLSHFHADHYMGLKSSFDSGQIYCTAETARLVSLHLRVPQKWLVPLELQVTHSIGGKKVTLVEANHCPGAAIFVFQIGLSVYVHTGDMRFESSLISEPFPVGLGGIRIDKLYLDTTYCDPRYSFPRQKEVLKAVDYFVKQEEESSTKIRNDRVLYVCGAYTIGKEKVWLQVLTSLEPMILFNT